MILMIEKIMFRSHSREKEEKDSLNQQEENISEVFLTETKCVPNPKNEMCNDFTVLENNMLYRQKKFKSETKLTNVGKKISHKKYSSVSIHRLSTIEDIYNPIKNIDKKEKEFKEIVSQLGKISTIVNEKCKFLLKKLIIVIIIITI
jgi:hypothetical protein